MIWMHAERDDRERRFAREQRRRVGERIARRARSYDPQPEDADRDDDEHRQHRVPRAASANSKRDQHQRERERGEQQRVVQVRIERHRQFRAAAKRRDYRAAAPRRVESAPTRIPRRTERDARWPCAPAAKSSSPTCSRSARRTRSACPARAISPCSTRCTTCAIGCRSSSAGRKAARRTWPRRTAS